MISAIEKRIHPRFAVALPLTVRLAGQSVPIPGREVAEQETLSHDISTSGVYFSLSEPCELGSPLDCVLTLPPDSEFGKSAQLRFHGRVVRVEKPSAGRIGVAAVIEKYAFTRAKET